MDEFSLIERYFNRPVSSDLVQLGIGDDGAVLSPPAGRLLVQTIDSLHSGYHFPTDTPPADIAWKSLAVNVSDLVAMGAEPAFFLMSLTLPDADEDFLEAFSRGLFDAARRFDIQLVGGDTCRGPLSITIQASGLAAPQEVIRRDGAAEGDHIFVSGQLGLAALGLALVEQRVTVDGPLRESALEALNRPLPRLDLLPLLRSFASAAIDISDGLVGDLGHLLRRSGVGARLDRDALPVPGWIRDQEAFELALAGGDDYQIVFTVAPGRVAELHAAIDEQALDCHEIGRITADGFGMYSSSDSSVEVDLAQTSGFLHFGR